MLKTISSLVGVAVAQITGLGTGIATALGLNAIGSGAIPLESDGTFIPIDSSGATLTFSASNGNYRKVGTTVLVWGSASYPSTASAVPAVIGGLPFTASNNSTAGFPAISLFASGVTFGFVNKNATTFGLGNAGAAVNNVVLSTTTVYFSGIYPTDA